MTISPPRYSPLLGAWCVLSMLASAPASLAEPVRRGGIEIGAKGVKATVIEVGQDAAAKPLMNLVSNTTIAQGVVGNSPFNPGAIRETADEAGKFAKQMREEFGVATENIRVIGSSGIPNASNKPDLIEAIKAATGVPDVQFLDADREVALTISGLVREGERGDVVLMDVGSGNTKGGYFDAGKPVAFSIPLGSVTFASRVTKDAAGAPFAEAAERLRKPLLEDPLAEQAKSVPQIAGRKYALLTGGAAYALATLIHPEAATQDRVVITASDIAEYSRRLRSEPGIPRPDLSGIPDQAAREAASQEVDNLLDTFKRENLIAGAELLVALVSAFNLQDKTLLFDRTAVTAWIRADTASVPPPLPPKNEVEQPSQEPGKTTAPPASPDDNKTKASARPVYPSKQSP